jgi:hypothetical protein
MLVLNCLLLNREYVVINALKALASIIFFSNITPRYFTLFTNGIFRPLRRDSSGLIHGEK